MSQAKTRRAAPDKADTALEEFRKELDRKLNAGVFKVTDYPKEYRAWWGAQRRCDGPHERYHCYGGRGIVFHDGWRGRQGFIRFLRHIGPAPSKTHSLDRSPNVNGHYIPGNVKWSTPQEQAAGQRSIVTYPYRGKELSIFQWARELNVSGKALYKRIREDGWPPAKALSTPVRPWQRAAAGR